MFEFLEQYVTQITAVIKKKFQILYDQAMNIPEKYIVNHLTTYTVDIEYMDIVHLLAFLLILLVLMMALKFILIVMIFFALYLLLETSKMAN